MREISADSGDAPEIKHIGAYEVVRLLGRGGMGQVYRARKPGGQGVVAIKVLAPELIGDTESVARFKREANAIVAVEHPNVARVLDHGVTDDGSPYLVMEFIDGPSMADLIRNRVELPYSKIARLMTEAALGLQAAFKQKIIHRDVKPANMMLSGETLKLVDFGLAKNLFENTFKTATGTILGTPRYMSPEQGRGQTLDHRSDMYSLGCSFYHLAAGQAPFEADTSLALMMKHIQTPLTPIYVVNPQVPADLAETLHRLLSKDPGDRYQDYDDLIAELRQVEMARRAKEEAVAGKPTELTVVDGFAQTSLFAANAHGGSASGATPPPAATLRHTHVVEPPPMAEVSTGGSGSRLLLFAVLAVIVLGGGLLLAQKTPDSQGRERSGWAVLAARLLGTGNEVSQHKDESARNNRLTSTRDKMDRLYSVCLTYLGMRGQFPRSVDDLSREGLATAEEIRDAWGRQFVIYPMGETVVSFGEDGIEDTEDDYRRGPDGFTRKPLALRDLEAAGTDQWKLGQ